MYCLQSNLSNMSEENFKILREEPTIHHSAIIINSTLGSWTDIGQSVNLNEVSVGDYTYFDGDTIAIYADIGKFCSIASHVRINAVSHPTWRVTQHHCTYRKVQYGFDSEDDQVLFQWRKANKVVIGHDVWIGHGAVIMPGVNIGTGAVIGAGAVVTKDVPQYGIAVGVPAKVIKKRFSDEVIDIMLTTKWWEWDRDTLKDRIEDFNSLEDFIENYYEG